MIFSSANSINWGRLAPQIMEENNYEMLFVINCYRPLTRDMESTMEVLHEIEYASHIKFTGIVNNSNLGELTTPSDVLDSLKYAQEVSEASGLPVVEGATYVAGIPEVLLKVISLGAVFFGAMTYIGNGPNFMVKAIAEENGVNMPSFFGYMFKFSLIVLLPVYILVQLIFL